MKGQGREAKVRRKLIANKERNWLLGLTLTSFAKLDANASLTDLERSIVEAFRRHEFTDEDLKQHGRLYQQLPDQTRRDILPGKFAGLTPRTNYSVQDLRQDAPNIVKSVLSMRNVENSDVQAIHEGRAHLRDFPPVSRDVLKEHGGAMLIALAPNRTRPNPRYTMKATSFRCNDRATDSIFGPANEIYWIVGSLGLGTAITTRSRIFGDVDAGEGRTCGATEGCIWGQDCAPQDFPEGEIGSMIQLWEHDEGNVDKIQAGVAAAFAAAAGILAATGVAAWVAAVVAGVGAVLQWLLGFLNDDHIADQTMVFTRQVVEDQLRKVEQAFDIVRRFADGDGDFTLSLKTTRVA